MDIYSMYVYQLTVKARRNVFPCGPYQTQVHLFDGAFMYYFVLYANETQVQGVHTAPKEDILNLTSIKNDISGIHM